MSFAFTLVVAAVASSDADKLVADVRKVRTALYEQRARIADQSDSLTPAFTRDCALTFLTPHPTPPPPLPPPGL